MTVRIINADVFDGLRQLPDESVHTVVTSPPYWGLRDYGVAGQIGLEETFGEWLSSMVLVFTELKRVLRKDGTAWLNIGDAYCSVGHKKSHSGYGTTGLAGGKAQEHSPLRRKNNARDIGLKHKDLMMMPARLAIALQESGWWLRSDIIWCLSGGTRVYARTKKGEMPMTIKDMVRLDPATVQLWNGEKWTQVLGWNQTPRPDRTYEIEFRCGQRIGCTAGHLWPTQRGNVRADELRTGDVVKRCRLPEPSSPKEPSALSDPLVGWFVGLYIAEGSRHDGTIQIASHTKEGERFAKLRNLARAFHGTAAVHKTSENGCVVSLNGPMLEGIIDTYVSGRIACDKHLHPRCWQRSDDFLRTVLDGYLSGDGHWDAKNQRWRLGFCNNDELVADLRTLGARLGVSVRLRRTVHTMGDAEFSGYRGELRFSRSDHHNSRDDGEVVEIRESRARKFWDIGVADEPHLFALSCGILTHNSKPNPMPESCRDRPTSAHEHIFLLTKASRYYYDADAVRETAVATSITSMDGGPQKLPNGSNANGGRNYTGGKVKIPGAWDTEPGAHGTINRQGRTSTQYKTDKQRGHSRRHDGFNDRWDAMPKAEQQSFGRNIRNVWTIATSPFPEAHFATFPAELVERCIKAGSPVGGRVLDPFGGSGTTGLVADRLGRDAILIELNPQYAEMARKRIENDAPMFAEVAATKHDPKQVDMFGVSTA